MRGAIDEVGNANWGVFSAEAAWQIAGRDAGHYLHRAEDIVILLVSVAISGALLSIVAGIEIAYRCPDVVACREPHSGSLADLFDSGRIASGFQHGNVPVNKLDLAMPNIECPIGQRYGLLNVPDIGISKGKFRVAKKSLPART
jgi:hypothetical protein